MRIAVTAVALVFICAMAFATVYVLLTEGPDVLSADRGADRRAAGVRRPGRALGAVGAGAASADALHAVPGRAEAAQAARARRPGARVRAGRRGRRGLRRAAAGRGSVAAALAGRDRAAAGDRDRAAGRRRHRAVAARGAARGAAATPSAPRFKHPPRSGLLFDIDTGRVLWRHDPTRVLPIASLTKMMTALVVTDRVAARREGQDHPRGAALPGLGGRAAPARQVDRGQHDAPRPAAAVGQRRGDRARPARREAPCRASSR